jgi:hypothetical protein
VLARRVGSDAGGRGNMGNGRSRAREKPPMGATRLVPSGDSSSLAGITPGTFGSNGMPGPVPTIPTTLYISYLCRATVIASAVIIAS